MLSLVLFLIANVKQSIYTMQEIDPKKERVIAYIDGFNLYFGMREAGFDHCKWLKIKKLVSSLLKPHQVLVDVRYFTSRVSNNPDNQKL